MLSQEQLHVFPPSPGCLELDTAHSPSVILRCYFFKLYQVGPAAPLGHGAVAPLKLPSCLLWPLTLPIVLASLGPQEGCLGLGHRGRRAIYS